MCNIAIYSVTLFCYTNCERGFCMEKWISKKELLAKTGISYGQLYRWKREKLIPDAWFIKRAAFTGQETFFPRERVLERISFILENKDRYALRELVEMLSPNPENRRYPAKALDAATSGLSSALARALCVEEWNHAQALCLLVASGARAQCVLAEEETLDVARGLLEWGNALLAERGQIAILRWQGEPLPLLIFAEDALLPSRGAQLLYSLPLSDMFRDYAPVLNKIDEEENP